MSDPRIAWLLNSPLAGLLQATGAAGAGGYIADDPAVRAWLEEKNGGGSDVRLLSAYILSGEKKIRFTNEIGALSSGQQAVEQELHLIKLDTGAKGADGEAQDFSKQVLITNTVGDAVQGLYQLIHSVFAPKLLGSADSTLSAKIQPDLISLESKLHKLSLIGGAPGSAAGEVDTSHIHSISDEVDYWAGLSTSGGHNGERARVFYEKFVSNEFDLGKKWEQRAVASMKNDELGRLLDDTQYCVSEVWLAQPDRGDGYPQARMEHLLHLISLALVQACKTHLSQSVQLWTDPFPQVQEALNSSLSLLAQWQASLDDLVLNEFGGRWKQRSAASAGKGSPAHAHEDASLSAFTLRLSDLLRLRSVHEELLHLLSPEDAVNFRLDSSVFDVFQRNGVDPLNTGVYAQPRWLGALADLDKQLGPVENHASTALKNRLYVLADKPELLMQEFSTFSSLLRRPAISAGLEAERKTLLQQLVQRVEELKNNFEQYSTDYSSSVSGGKAPPSLKNQPSVFLSKIIWSNQLVHRVQQIVGIVRNILTGIPGQERFLTLASDLRGKIEAYARELFDRWHSEILENLNDPQSSIRLETSGKLMDLDLTGSGELVM
jgi:hypothetical protein